MIEQDREQFVALLQSTMDLYGKELGKGAIYLWWASLERFDYPAVRAAMSAWAQNPDQGQFAPLPANIIRMIEGSTGDRGLMVWSKVEAAIRCVGHYRSIAFDDPIIHRVIEDMGGWIRLASTPSEKDLEFQAKEFVRRYQAIALAGGPKQDYVPYLVGESEATKNRNGFKHDDPLALVGREELVRLVMQNGKGQACIELTMKSIGSLMTGMQKEQIADRSESK